MTYGSLFSGIGGMDLGLDRAGLTCRWQVEIDDYCRRVLSKHWPEVPKYGDIRKIKGHELERVALIAGGDPCEANSNARRHGTEPVALGQDFIRIVRILRPACVLRENPAHVRADAPWPWQRFRSELESLGYAVLPFKIRACCLGAQHRRERLFLLGSLPHAGGPRLQGYEFEDLAGPYLTGGTQVSAQESCHSAGRDWGHAAPRISRSSDGIPNRLDRIRALGKAVYPDVAEWIGRRLQEANHA